MRHATDKNTNHNTNKHWDSSISTDDVESVSRDYGKRAMRVVEELQRLVSSINKGCDQPEVLDIMNDVRTWTNDA